MTITTAHPLTVTAPGPATWTLAYRHRRANRFLRVDNWAGTFDQAMKMAGRMIELHPELEIWWVPTAEAEQASSCDADRGNILVDSGRRVRIAEGGKLPAELLPRRCRTCTAELAAGGPDICERCDIHSVDPNDVCHVEASDRPHHWDVVLYSADGVDQVRLLATRDQATAQALARRVASITLTWQRA